MEQVLQLRAEKDELLLELERHKHRQQQGQQPVDDAAGAAAQQHELAVLRLQKEQAVASALRLKQELAQLFHAAGADDDGGAAGAAGAAADAAGSNSSRGPHTAHSIGGGGRRPASAAAGLSLRRPTAGGSRQQQQQQGKGCSSAREAELLATVANLQAALERATSCSVPTPRHMQEVQQRKASQHEAGQLKADVERLKSQLAAAHAKAAEAQAANASLRVAASDLKQRLLLAADGVLLQPAGGAGPPPAPQPQQGVQSAVPGEPAVLDGSSSDKRLAQQLAGLQQQASALQRENGELRQELASFDPAFFEELEDLKHAHHQLQQKAAGQGG